MTTATFNTGFTAPAASTATGSSFVADLLAAVALVRSTMAMANAVSESGFVTPAQVQRVRALAAAL